MDYQLDGEKPLIVFEVFLPKKWRYRRKLREVLDAFFSEQSLREVPVVADEIKTKSERDQSIFLSRLRQVVSGYSIYQVDGRFGTSNGPIDERTWVIRFLMHDPQVTGGMMGSFLSLSRNVITYLIAQRFATEIGEEQEIWFVEYQHCFLRRWKQQNITACPAKGAKRCLKI